MASEVCQPHSGHVINQHGMSRPNSNRYSLAFSTSRPKTDQPSITPRDLGDWTDQESLDTERSSILQRPMTARPISRRSRTFVTTDEGGSNNTSYHTLGKNMKNVQGTNPTHAPTLINSYYNHSPGYDFEKFSGNIRDDEEYYLDMDPIEYFYSPVFDLYPYGYILKNQSKTVQTPKKYSNTYPSTGDIESKENLNDNFLTTKTTKETRDSDPRTLQPVNNLSLKANPFPPRSRLPVPIANPTFKKAIFKHDTSPTVQSIEYRRDLFEPKQKITKMGSLANNSSLLSHEYQTEQTKAPNKRGDTFSNSKINYLGAKRKQNDTVVKSGSSNSKFEVVDRDPDNRTNSLITGDLVNQPTRDDSNNRLKSREKCSYNRLREYSHNSPNYSVSKKPSELNIERSPVNGKQSVKYLGNRERSHKFSEKWTTSGRMLDSHSILTKHKSNVTNQQPLFRPKAPEVPNQIQSRDQNATRRPLSEDINSVIAKENNSSEVKADRLQNSPFVGKSKHPYLRTGKQLSLPKIRPQTEKPPLLEVRPPNSPPRKLKPILVKFDNMHF
ncbi:uncharacterized protein LOC133174179 [Saccostrea echinata]|uniref:uncharacterized protein LOC133174179 n=1 Tax=Saccostrea echinata TaxID=191078 RepID=UPI002A8219C6|nr:uncharacterized protein LOC133174179 [Saccostrea echinata]XP_061165227.1 uncharacterized protein LOC133174179 [Saccostrea echinata]